MSVVINATNFPDTAFRRYVSNYIDLDADGVLSDYEIDRVTSLTLTNCSNFTGIDYFTNIETLTINDCSSGINIDYRAFANLKSLTIDSFSHGSFDTNVDFSYNTALENVTINLCAMYGLKFGKSVTQVYINCKEGWSSSSGETHINTFDFSKCTNIERVTMYGFTHGGVEENIITGLSNKKRLWQFHMSMQFVKELVLDGCTALSVIDVTSGLELESISLRGCTSLDSFHTTLNPQLKTLLLEGCTALTTLECTKCNLRPQLDLSDLTALERIDVTNNPLHELILGDKPNLTTLQCFTTQDKIPIEELDLNGCPNLKNQLVMEDWRTIDGTRYEFYHNLPSANPYDSTFAFDNRTVCTPIAINASAGDTVEICLESEIEVSEYCWHGNKLPSIGYRGGSTYSVVALPESDGDTYYCDGIANDGSGLFSRTYVINVLPGIYFNTDLKASTKAGVGKNVTFSVKISGIIAESKLQESADNGGTWTDIYTQEYSPTITADKYVLTKTIAVTDDMDGHLYRYLISNDDMSRTSSAQKLHVVQAPVIEIHPKSITCKSGASVTFAVTASGEGIVYQWQEKIGSNSYANIEEEGTDYFYTFAASKDYTNRKYRCIVSNIAGSVTSSAATLTVLDPPVITSDLTDQIVEDGSTVILTVGATGDNLSYRWQYSSNNKKTWKNIADAISDTYAFVADTNGSGVYYRCVVSNSVGTVTSAEKQITVIVLPSIDEQPTSLTVGNGEVATFRFTIAGDASDYQWQVLPRGETSWANVPENGNNIIYSVTAEMSMSGNRYRCLVGNALNNTKIKTKTVTLAVFNPIIISVPAEAYTLEADVDTDALFVVEASGDDLQYQWQASSTEGEKWTDITDETSPNCIAIATNRKNGWWYRCKVYNDYLTVYSPIITLLVIVPPPPIIKTEPSSVSAGIGKSASFSVEVDNPPATYQWQVSTNNGSSWSNISNDGSEASYTIVSASTSMHGYLYRCVLTNAYGTTTTSAASLSIIPPPVITRNLASVSATVGSTVSFSIEASGEQISYQWQYSKNGGTTWKTLSSAASKNSTYSFAASETYDGYQFRCLISNPSASDIASDAALLTISTAPVITKDISGVTVNDGESITFTIKATGGDLHYQWQVSNDSGRTWSNVDDGNAATYITTISAEQNQIQYQCVVTNTIGSAVSNNAIVSVRSRPRIITPPRSITAAYGVVATFIVNADGGDLKYQWQQSMDDGETWKDIKGYTELSFSVTATAARNGRQFRCVVTNVAGSTTSDAAVFTTFKGDDYTEEDDDQTRSGVYLPSEMADAIRRIIGIGGGTNLDEIAFGAMTEDDLYSLSTNPGLTDPIYYEKIGEALNELLSGVDYRNYDVFTEKLITQNGEYVAFDDHAYGYSTVVVKVQQSESGIGAVSVADEILTFEKSVDSVANETLEI